MKNLKKLSRAEMREVAGGGICNNPCTPQCKLSIECTAFPDGACVLATCTDPNCAQIKVCSYA